MLKTKRFLSGMFLACLVSCTGCYAAFEDLGAGARALGMGNAFVGMADDVSAVYYNPAGISRVKGIEIGASYAQYYPGLTYDGGIGDGLLMYCQPLEGDMGAVGLGYLERRASALYREGTFTLSYGKEFRRAQPFCLGISLKYHSKSYRSEYKMTNPVELDPVFQNGTSASGLGIDIGILYMFSEFTSAGIFLGEVNSPNISLKDNDPVPFSFKFGISWKLGEQRNYTLNIDGGYRDQDLKLNLGIENWFKVKTTEVQLGTQWGRTDTIGWRAGFAFGTNGYRSISAGAGYRIGGPDLQFDYAFIYPLGGIKNTWGTHRLSMTVRP